ncbi:hypothetical protein ONZ51_g12848 [Trametes cubensis]|uniref:Uncharacterized protein n=1 Tax=Trametes cubensis TaxID=1111947 RepID=A0AAD7TGF1_9APHY|nr:hypothetical protein ONZ51_g12848 [Trametes cubensis]
MVAVQNPQWYTNVIRLLRPNPHTIYRADVGAGRAEAKALVRGPPRQASRKKQLVLINRSASPSGRLNKAANQCGKIRQDARGLASATSRKFYAMLFKLNDVRAWTELRNTVATRIVATQWKERRFGGRSWLVMVWGREEECLTRRAGNFYQKRVIGEPMMDDGEARVAGEGEAGQSEPSLCKRRAERLAPMLDPRLGLVLRISGSF